MDTLSLTEKMVKLNRARDGNKKYVDGKFVICDEEMNEYKSETLHGTVCHVVYVNTYFIYDSASKWVNVEAVKLKNDHVFVFQRQFYSVIKNPQKESEVQISKQENVNSDEDDIISLIDKTTDNLDDKTALIILNYYAAQDKKYNNVRYDYGIEKSYTKHNCHWISCSYVHFTESGFLNHLFGFKLKPEKMIPATEELNTTRSTRTTRYKIEEISKSVSHLDI
jgi:hypothetical protein